MPGRLGGAPAPRAPAHPGEAPRRAAGRRAGPHRRAAQAGEPRGREPLPRWPHGGGPANPPPGCGTARFRFATAWREGWSQGPRRAAGCGGGRAKSARNPGRLCDSVAQAVLRGSFSEAALKSVLSVTAGEKKKKSSFTSALSPKRAAMHV